MRLNLVSCNDFSLQHSIDRVCAKFEELCSRPNQSWLTVANKEDTVVISMSLMFSWNNLTILLRLAISLTKNNVFFSCLNHK